MTKRVYFTICSANYLAYAKTLHASLRDADPQAASEFRVVLVDGPLDESIRTGLPFDVVHAEALGIAHFWDMAMRYSVMEFNTAVKPAAFLYFMEKGANEVVYLDPDIFVTRPLEHVHKALAGGAHMVLTPHSTMPLEDGLDPDDIRLLRTGAYNLGFLACASSGPVREYLNWWHRRMLGDCRVDLENGLFVDQKFMDLAPSYLEHVEILRHKGYNAAYWNLASRPIAQDGSGWSAGGDPLHFFHFSGVVPGDHSVFSKHQNRFRPGDIGHLRILLDQYLNQIAVNHHVSLSKIPYAYGSFLDGQPIPDIYRKVYAELHPPAPRSREEAFRRDHDLIFGKAKGYANTQVPITHLMYRIWRDRPDLQTSFPLCEASGRRAFSTWFVQSGKREYKLPEEFVAPVAEALNLGHGSAGGAAIFSPRWMAGKAMAASGRLRGLYRHLPEPVRARAREFLVRKAAGHGRKGARIASRGRFDRDLSAGIGLYGNFTAVSGVGEGARRMARILQVADIPSSSHLVTTNGSAAEILPAPKNLLFGRSDYNCLLFHVNADHIPMVLDALQAEELRGRYRIGYWAWELAEFPVQWAEAFDYLDEVWVPSRFVQEAVSAKTNKPVLVVPHPVFDRPDSGEGRLELGLPENRFLFLCSLDLNSFASRKNPFAAYEAFSRAFPNRDDPDAPFLVMKLHGNPGHSDEHRELVQLFAQDPRLVVIEMPLSGERYAALQRNCDAFVSLHRSEGFGMNIAECMYLGKPVIATDYSGNTDYLTSENGFPVRYDLVSVQPGEYPFGAGQYWAEPDLDQAAEIMRRIHMDQAKTAEVSAAGREHVRRVFSLESVADLVMQHYRRIQNEIKTRAL